MSVSPGALEAAAAALSARHGLRFDGVGLQRLARGLEAAAAEVGTDPADLAGHLAARPRAEADLLDRVTLQETSFFRDEGTWRALAGALADGPAGRGTASMVWSAGCANGQEAWSLVMLLEELGLGHVQVLASDVSPAAVARTTAGVYGERELRGLDPDRRRRFMEPCPGGWRVRSELRGRLRAVRHNVARETLAAPDASCAVVLCRYVLIYLEAEGCRRLLVEAARVLAPGGRLVIGAAESLWQLSEDWVAEPFADAAAYTPRARAAAPVPASRAPRPPVPPRLPPRTAPAPAARPEALRAAGEAAFARGDHAGAERAYRGAAYLDPDDPLAHLGLGLALEAAGDQGARRAFAAAWTALGTRGPAGLGDHLGGYRPEELARLLADKLGAR